MTIDVRIEVEPPKEEDIYTLINRIHRVYTDKILNEVRNRTPYESGEMQGSWHTLREDIHTTHIFNDAEHARYLFEGTGLWGPHGTPICARLANHMVFNWRWKGYQLQVRKCVRGINPRAIRGGPGVIYDFAQDMEDGVGEGVTKATQEMRE